MKNYLNYLKQNKYSINTINTYRSILNLYKNNLNDIRGVKKQISTYFKVPNTAWTHYNVISSYYKWNKDPRQKLLIEMRLPKIPSKYMISFTKDFLYKRTEVSEIDTITDIKKKIIIRFLFETGIRASELYQIKSINSKTITILGKGNKYREVFHNNETTKKLPLIDFTSKTLRLWVKEILGNKFTPHSIRRSFATYLLVKGANPKMVMLQLGHEKIETTFRYLQLSIDQNKKIYDKFF